MNETSTVDVDSVAGDKYESTSTIAIFITLGLIGKFLTFITDSFTNNNWGPGAESSEGVK